MGIFVAVTAESNKAMAAVIMGLSLIILGTAFLLADRGTSLREAKSPG